MPEYSIFVTESFIWIPYALTWDTKLYHHYDKGQQHSGYVIMFSESNE